MEYRDLLLNALDALEDLQYSEFIEFGSDLDRELSTVEIFIQNELDKIDKHD